MLEKFRSAATPSPAIDYATLVNPAEAPEKSRIRRAYDTKVAMDALYQEEGRRTLELERLAGEKKYWLENARWGDTEIMEYMRTKAEFELLSTTLKVKQSYKSDAALNSDAADRALARQYSEYQNAVRTVQSTEWQYMDKQKRQKVYDVIDHYLTPVE